MEPASHQPTQPEQTPPWEPTACILCENNCGIEVQLGGDDGRQFTRLRGDRANPVSKGYVCQKAGRLNHYQNSRDRVLSPLRRRPDGSFEEIDWDTAIREVAERFAGIRDRFGGESIFYYGGGGQGNHLPGFYARSTLRTLGSVFRSNALAQEKTGEMWVAGQMVGAHSRGDFHHCEVGIFLGKNPWQSHGIPRARVTLRALAKDPERCLIVIDVRRSETADLADIFLQVKPGTDAWLLMAMLGVLLEEGLVNDDFVARHTDGFDEVRPHLEQTDIHAACSVCGVSEDLVRTAVRRIARASSVSVFEDLGVQMNRNSTLVSYLQRLVWMLTGNFAKTGAMNVTTSLVPLTAARSSGPRETPVTGAPVIAGLVPCNRIAEEVLGDHPKRFRAMLVESANPVHSLAESRKMRAALDSLEFVVAIDVAMTETARLADYVLPATTQYEKAEAVFFNFEFPENAFFLRRALLAPPPTDKAGPLPEPEIHCRLTEALGGYSGELVEELRSALRDGGRAAFADAFMATIRENPRLAGTAPALLYRTLGETLPADAKSGAALWSAARICARRFPDSVRRAGIEGKRRRTRRSPVRRDHRQPTGPGVLRRPARSQLGSRADGDRPPPACDPGTVRGDRRPCRGGRSRHHQRDVPPRALSRRAPLVHGEHDLPRSQVAAQGAGGGAGTVAERRRGPRDRGRRPGPPGDFAGRHRGPRRDQRPHAGRAHLPSERSRPRLSRRGRPAHPRRRRVERTDRRRRPRSHRRHALAQERPGSPGTDPRCRPVRTSAEVPRARDGG